MTSCGTCDKPATEICEGRGIYEYASLDSTWQRVLRVRAKQQIQEEAVVEVRIIWIFKACLLMVVDCFLTMSASAVLVFVTKRIKPPRPASLASTSLLPVQVLLEVVGLSLVSCGILCGNPSTETNDLQLLQNGIDLRMSFVCVCRVS
jgi:hypothetical protein